MTLRAQTPEILYTLAMPDPSSHLFEVTAEFSRLPSGGGPLDLVMPAWRPGRYLILDFAGGVQEFSAADGDGAPLRWEKVDKNTWRIARGRAAVVRARYRVYANEFGQRTRGLNNRHGFINGCAVFMYVEQYRSRPVTLRVTPYEGWHVTTGLDSVPQERNTFTAPSYDYFVDCPLEIGTQLDYDFTVGGVRHTISVAGESNCKPEILASLFSKLVLANREFWGSLPYERYCFLIHTGQNIGGGTEHINSTIIGVHPSVFATAESHQNIVGLVSHEYFHTWNVKQFRPRALTPYDFTKEAYAKEYWIAEGFTSYYGTLLMRRAGLLTPAQLLADFARDCASDRARPGNAIQTLNESSFDSWIKLWKNRENAYNSETELYGKGANVGLLLDLEIRQRSRGKASLDDVMRALYKRFPLGKPGYTVDDFRRLCEQYAGSSFSEYFENYVDGLKPLPWEQTLLYAGVKVEWNDAPAPWLGLGTSDVNGRARVNAVVAGSPAASAGFDLGDEVIAIDNRAVTAQQIPERISMMKQGDTVRVSYFREGELRTAAVILKNRPFSACAFVKVPQPSALQKKLYEDWIQARWDE